MSTRVSINTAVWGLVGFGDNNNLAAVYANYPSPGSLNGLNRVNAVATQSSFPCGAVTGWNVLEIQRSSSSTTYALNGVATGSISQYLLTGSRPIYTWSQASGQNIQLDWIYIRNFAAIEPSHSSWSAGEPNPSPPIAAFSASPVSGQVPLLVQFTDVSSISPTSWQWDFGDATPTSTLQSPAHTYSSPGNYTVTLTVTNAYGTSTIQKIAYITVTPPPPFLDGWSYRKLHTISGSASGALTDYQVRFKVYNTTGTDTGENVYLGSHVKPDFSDLRFTTIDNTVLTYWVQETGSNYAVVWVKVPSIPTTGTQMYLYYGNSVCILSQ